MTLLQSLRRAVPRSVKRSLRRLLESARPENRARIDTPSHLAIETFGGFAVAYRRGTADESVIQHSFDNDIFFAGMPQYRPQASDIIVDVGAHIGTFSLLAARFASEGQVYSIEASQDTFNFLRINTALNPGLTISPVHLALSSEDGVVTLHHDAGNWGHSIVKQLSSKSETVASQSLDSFFAQHAIRSCDFIKFNCEGAEFPVLYAASEHTLAAIRRMLIANDLEVVTHSPCRYCC